MRERISITISSDLLSEVDDFVDGVKVRNRSHAIEVLLQKALTRSLPPVYVLAGEAEKCMKRLEGKPLLQHTLELLSRQGFEKVTMAVIGDEVKDYFRDGSGLGLEIGYVEEEGLTGTARALADAEELWEETFLVVYGDNYFDFDLTDLVSFHRKSKSVGTVALTTSGSPGDYGVINLKGGKVVGFTEKPEKAESYLVSTGIFVFEAGIFDYLGESSSLEREVLARVVKKEELAGYVMEGKWAAGDDKRRMREMMER